MSFLATHLADSVPPSPAARTAIAALLANLAIPNPAVYGAQGSAALAPGYNLYAYATKYAFLPDVALKQAVFCQQEKDWRGLGVAAGPMQANYGIEPLHFRVDQHLVIAETHPDDATRKLAWKQAAEAVSTILVDKVCLPGVGFTNPRGYGWTMKGLRNFVLATGDAQAAAGWLVCLDKLRAQVGTNGDGEPYLTLHPAGADHGLKSVCVWMTAQAGHAAALGSRDYGGFGASGAVDAVTGKALACLVHAEKTGSELTHLPGRLVDDYLKGPWLKPGSEKKYGTMSRWAYPCALDLARAGVPGAEAFLEGPIRTAFFADNLMRPSDWKVGNGYGSMHAASIATYMAPAFGFR